MDKYPVTVTGPVKARNARMFTFNDRLFIAESRNRGRDVTRVTEHDMPDGNPGRGRTGKWGSWRYSGCGCSSKWGKHSREQLAGMANGDT